MRLPRSKTGLLIALLYLGIVFHFWVMIYRAPPEVRLVTSTSLAFLAAPWSILLMLLLRETSLASTVDQVIYGSLPGVILNTLIIYFWVSKAQRS